MINYITDKILFILISSEIYNFFKYFFYSSKKKSQKAINASINYILLYRKIKDIYSLKLHLYSIVLQYV